MELHSTRPRESADSQGGNLPKTEFPEAELVKCAYTIRHMDLPPNIKMTKRSMLRWFALSFGLISERESRSTILDVLDSLFYLQFTKNIDPTSDDIQAFLKSKSKKVSDKLLRYHLKRLCDMRLTHRRKLRYHFSYDPYSERHDLEAGFKHHISAPLNNCLKDIGEVLQKLGESYGR